MYKPPAITMKRKGGFFFSFWVKYLKLPSLITPVISE